jgi:hypothetical protein
MNENQNMLINICSKRDKTKPHHCGNNNFKTYRKLHCTFGIPNLDKEFRYTPRVINASQRVNKILLEAKTINRPKEKTCFVLSDVYS